MQRLNYLTMLSAVRSCVNTDRFKIGIFTKTFADQTCIFSELLESMDQEEQEKKVRSVRNTASAFIDFKNGSHIDVIAARENTRGHAFNRVLYEDGISDEVLNCVVRPTEKIRTNDFRMRGDENND